MSCRKNIFHCIGEGEFYGFVVLGGGFPALYCAMGAAKSLGHSGEGSIEGEAEKISGSEWVLGPSGRAVGKPNRGNDTAPGLSAGLYGS